MTDIQDPHVKQAYSWLQKHHKPLFLLLTIVMLYSFFIPEAHANLNFVGDKIKNKINDIVKVIEAIAKAGAGVGVLWLVISFLKGEPNYRYAYSLIVGGCLLFGVGRITVWAIS